MSVVTRAAAFWPETEALVERDGGGVAGADFEGEMVGTALGGPGEEGAQEAGADALAPGVGVNDDGVELAEVLFAVEEEGGGGEGVDPCWLVRGVDDEEAAVRVPAEILEFLAIRCDRALDKG